MGEAVDRERAPPKCFGTKRHEHCYENYKKDCPHRLNCIVAFLKKRGVIG